MFVLLGLSVAYVALSPGNTLLNKFTSLLFTVEFNHCSNFAFTVLFALSYSLVVNPSTDNVACVLSSNNVNSKPPVATDEYAGL